MAFGFPPEYADRHCISLFEYFSPAPKLRWGIFVEGFTITRLLQDIPHWYRTDNARAGYPDSGVRDFEM